MQLHSSPSVISLTDSDLAGPAGRRSGGSGNTTPSAATAESSPLIPFSVAKQRLNVASPATPSLSGLRRGGKVGEGGGVLMPGGTLRHIKGMTFWWTNTPTRRLGPDVAGFCSCWSAGRGCASRP